MTDKISLRKRQAKSRPGASSRSQLQRRGSMTTCRAHLFAVRAHAGVRPAARIEGYAPRRGRTGLSRPAAIQRSRCGWWGGLHAEQAVKGHVDAAANHVGRGLLFLVVQIFDAGRKVVGYRELPTATGDPTDLVLSERSTTGGV